MSSQVRALVFDAYGTLFDPFAVRTCAEELFPGNGTALQPTLARQAIGIFMAAHADGALRKFLENHRGCTDLQLPRIETLLRGTPAKATDADLSSRCPHFPK